MDIGPVESVHAYQESVAGIRRDIKETAGIKRLKKPFSYTDATEVGLEAEGVTLYEMFPYDAKENYTFEIFEIVKTLEKHFHKIPTQLMLVLDGAVEVTLGGKIFDLENGDFIVIPPNVMHSIKPKEGKSRFLTVDFPGFNYPEEGYQGPPIETLDKPPYIYKQGDSATNNALDLTTKLPKEIAPLMQILTRIIPKYYRVKREGEGYSVYDIAEDNDKKWDVAILDIQDTPKHVHKIGSEHFIALTGILEVTVNDKTHRLMPGQSIRIHPGDVHKLKSAKDDPVRVLCVSFPAFDPGDLYLAEAG